MAMVTALLIDDSPEDTELLSELITDGHPDFRVLSATCGRDGIDLFKDHQPDCVILDYRLAGEDGLSILSELQDINPYSGTIMMSGQGSEEVAVESMKLGAMDYLVKNRLSGITVHSAIRSTLERCRLQRKIDEQHQEQQAFLRTLVHDIKSPLRNLRQASAYLIQEINSDSPSGIDELVGIQETMIDHTESLVDTLQTYALLDNEVEFARVSLDEVLDEICMVFRGTLDNSNARINRPDSLGIVRGHKPQLLQLFQNLVGNGLKYNKSETPLVEVTCHCDEHNMSRVCVTDNGIGIPEKHRESVFKPLMRVHSSSQYSGTGLGLAICDKIVRRHGGRIWVEPGSDGGSQFHFTLPRAI